MKKKHFIIAAFFLTVLAGCDASAPVSSAPVDVTFTGNPVIKKIAGYTTITVRAQRKSADGKRSELGGVTCNMQGNGFTAKLVTPAIVRMPDAGPQTRPVTLTCTADGQTRSLVAEPYNITSHRNSSAAATNGGLIGALASAVVEGSRDKSRDSFGYTDITVGF